MAAKYGMKVVADETYAATDTDMSPQLTKIKNAPGVQAIFGCGFGAPDVDHRAQLEAARDDEHPVLLQPRRRLAAIHRRRWRRRRGRPRAGARRCSSPTSSRRTIRRSGWRSTTSPGLQGRVQPADLDLRRPRAMTACISHSTRSSAPAAPTRRKVRDEIEKTKGFVGVDGIYNMTRAGPHGPDPRSPSKWSRSRTTRGS